MSDGLYRAVNNSVGGTGDNQLVNTEIAAIVAAQFETQSTYRDVAQAAVDQVVREHFHAFESSSTTSRSSRAHSDITLIVRGFDYPLAVASPIRRALSSAVPMMSSLSSMTSSSSTTAPLSIIIPPPSSSSVSNSELSPPRPFFGGIVSIGGGGGTAVEATTASVSSMGGGGTDGGGVLGGGGSHDSTYEKQEEEEEGEGEEGDQTQSSEEMARAFAALDLDETGRVASYVDLSEFDAALDAMTEDERRSLFADLAPRPDFDRIPEESEVTCVGRPTDRPTDEVAFVV